MSLLTQSPKPTASVIDGSLVLSFPQALTPIVMRLSLEEAKSAAFSIQEHEGAFQFIVKISEKDTRDIAAFATREAAVDALMITSKALEKGARPANDSGASSIHGAMSAGALKWAGAFAVLIVLLWVISSMSSGVPHVSQGAQADDRSRASFSSDPAATGVPVTADDFLTRR